MPLPEPRPGLVISYSYLWKRQADGGEISGRKDRPCAIIIAAETQAGESLVYAVPITHLVPAADSEAVEIPRNIKRRLGLDDAPSWIVVTEMNCFVWPGVDLRPVFADEPTRFVYGALPFDIFDKVKQAIIRRLRARTISLVKRGE